MIKRIVALALLVGVPAVCPAAESERSVVQILTFAQQPVWDAPWRFDAVRPQGGSGFVIKHRRIMTNAHVVSWAKQIIVRRFQDPKPYIAEVEYIGHDCDLAVLTVADSSFFENLEPLDFGGLPLVRSTVTTCGYPAGGEEISYTRGVVSRIELAPYSHIGNRQFLSVQTDAAINPGNSGGPVLQDGRVVGVAFQNIPKLQSAGFFIPVPVVEHFLRDIEDGRYNGFPYTGIRIVPLQNPDYRRYLGLADDNEGARVDSVLSIPGSQGVVKPEDVLLRIGSYAVASDATILYESNRVSAGLAFQFAQAGETVPLRIWREGKALDVSFPATVYEGDRGSGYQNDTPPPYLVYGGLVFTPLSSDYLRSLASGSSDSAKEMYLELYYKRFEDPASVRPEPIVMASVLPDPVNANTRVRGRVLVDRINGTRIDTLKDAVRAFESNTNAVDIVEFLPYHTFECLDRREVARSQARILKTYSIAQDRRL